MYDKVNKYRGFQVKMVNTDIKLLLRKNRITQKEVAYIVGIRPETLCRKLKTDLSADLKCRIFAAILTVTRQKYTHDNGC